MARCGDAAPVARGGSASARQAAQRQSLGISTTAADRLVAEHPNHVWALDYQFDQTTMGMLAVEVCNTLLEAQVLVEDWRIEYNTVRAHSALGYLTPTQ